MKINIKQQSNVLGNDGNWWTVKKLPTGELKTTVHLEFVCLHNETFEQRDNLYCLNSECKAHYVPIANIFDLEDVGECYG